jgi:hypothetical protein
MQLTALRHPAWLILVSSLSLWGRAGAQELPADEARKPSFWEAASLITAVNGLTWVYNWHIQRWDWADVGTRSWWANVRRGFTWDDDAFGANQAAHPYHGSLYFNAARGSGYGFWGSAPFVAGGSLSWELFTENVRPSLNDLINTTLGGMALGEVSYRLSSLFTSAKRPPAGGQMGAVLASPVSRARSLVYGAGRGRSLQFPESNAVVLAIGQRRGLGVLPGSEGGHRPFVGLTFQYGSPFDASVSRPYDAFEFSLHLSPDDHVVLTHAAISGLLTRQVLARSSSSQLLLGLFQHYDYDDLPLAKSSSQSLSAALLYRRSYSTRTHAEIGMHLEVVPLGAVSSEHGLVRRRDYDFGPGIGGRLTGALRHGGRELVRLDGRTMWIHSLYSAGADHLTSTARLSTAIPVIRAVRMGADVSLTIRQSSYRNEPAVTARVPQFRVYLGWSPT